eukprot:5927159-Alexandrium_andersonii.AAC.1
MPGANHMREVQVLKSAEGTALSSRDARSCVRGFCVGLCAAPAGSAALPCDAQGWERELRP